MGHDDAPGVAMGSLSVHWEGIWIVERAVCGGEYAGSGYNRDALPRAFLSLGLRSSWQWLLADTTVQVG